MNVRSAMVVEPPLCITINARSSATSAGCTVLSFSTEWSSRRRSAEFVRCLPTVVSTTDRIVTSNTY